MPRTSLLERKPLMADDAALVVLVERIRCGDHAALGELYDQTCGRLHALVRRVLADPRDVEEALADVYLQVWDRAAAYCPSRGQVLAWLNTLAWSRAHDLNRRNRRGPPCALHPEAALEAYTFSDEPTPPELAEWQARAAAVRQALQSLPAGQRQVLELGFLEELSQSEIAERTGLPLGTVKSHARRGLARLRQAMEGQETEQ